MLAQGLRVAGNVGWKRAQRVCWSFAGVFGLACGCFGMCNRQGIFVRASEKSWEYRNREKMPDIATDTAIAVRLAGGLEHAFERVIEVMSRAGDHT